MSNLKEGRSFVKKFFNEKGLTLIEVLASLVILMIVFTGLMHFFSNAYSYTNRSQNKTAGINVARSALAFMERQSFIEMNEQLNQSASAKPLYVYICTQNNSTAQYYKYTKLASPPNGCAPITINNIPFQVKVTYDHEKGQEKELNKGNYKYTVPVIVSAEWKRNNEELSTTVKGAIVSEDIRETY
nr:prepilin-type N-terminal cleavage/methylation domain-containing protein [Priestia flexa]